LNCKEEELSAIEEKCPKTCETVLECGHVCKSRCGDCFSSQLHAPCEIRVERELFCGHRSTAKCSEQFTKPCERSYELRCGHMIKRVKCMDTITIGECFKPCKNSCAHSKCTRKCHEECDKQACDRDCEITLRCGHKCAGLCGEVCPRLCKICNRDRLNVLLSSFKDKIQRSVNLELRNARFIYLPTCKHIIECSLLDKWIEQNFKDSKEVIFFIFFQS
jgi:hypothetical protein